MNTNETLALDDTRHDDADWGSAPEGGLETKGRLARPGAPAVRRTDPNANLARTIARQGEQIAAIAHKLTADQARQRVANLRLKQSGTAELRREVAPATRSRRPDPLDADRVNRATRGVVAREQRADNALAIENRRLSRELETRERQMRRPAMLRQAGPGYSAKSQAFATYRRSVLQYLKTGDTTFGGLSLRDLERKAGLNTAVNPDGGYLVHPEHDTGPLEQLLMNAVVMRAVATVRPIAGGSLKKAVSLRGSTATWVGEQEARSETGTPDLAELEFPAMELYAKPKATQSMLEDAMIDVEAWLSGEVADQFAESEEIAFTSGNGVKKPRGFLDYDKIANGSWAWGSLGFTVTGASGAFPTAGAAVNQGDPLWTLIYGLKAGHRTAAKFMMNSGTVGVCRTLKDGEGRWIWSDARDSNPSMLCGFETVVNEQMPAIGAGTFSIAFGDFAKGYVIVDRVGISVLRDPYSAKPYIEFYTRKRVGGGVQNFEAIKLLKFAAS
jgi:HK97 family phage major capsid protein